ncbi:MAG: response regulator transcription factor [Sediminibacterium sp.]|nr:response regulator transcription factor [Sediminibacterium sp.]
MVVKVLAVSKNFTALKFLTGLLDTHIEIIDYCVLSEAYKQYELFNPDVLLLEINWPRPHQPKAAYEVIEKLLQANPLARIVAMTHFYDKATQQTLISAGVLGYVYLASAGMSSKEILVHFNQTILAVGTGESFFMKESPIIQ